MSPRARRRPDTAARRPWIEREHQAARAHIASEVGQQRIIGDRAFPLRRGTETERCIAFHDEQAQCSRAVQLEDEAALELERVGQQADGGQRFADQAPEAAGVGMAAEDFPVRRVETDHRAAHGGALHHESRQIVVERRDHRSAVLMGS